MAKAGAHSLTQGVMSFMQGGNFWGGALSGVFTSVSNDLLGLATDNLGDNNILKSDGFALFNGAVSGGVGSVLVATWGKIAMGGAIGVFTGGVGAAVGASAATAAATVGIQGDVLGGAIAGASGGAVAGAINGFATSVMFGEDVIEGTVMGGLSGAALGGALGGLQEEYSR